MKTIKNEIFENFFQSDKFETPRNFTFHWGRNTFLWKNFCEKRFELDI